MRVRKLRVGGGQAKVKLLDFLADALGVSRNKAKSLIDSRGVFVNDARVWMAQHNLFEDDLVEVHDKSATYLDENILNEVLFEDDQFLVCNKPAGILSNGPGSLEAKIQWHRKNPKLFAVHRLDKDTSGCLLFAKNERAQLAGEDLFRQRLTHKVYYAIVMGRVPRTLTKVTHLVAGKPALTRIAILRANNEATLLEVTIETGRTHQIRKHLSSSGYPIIGDRNYATKLLESSKLRKVSRQMLHARTLEFRAPHTGTLVRCTAPFPGDFKGCLKAVGLEYRG